MRITFTYAKEKVAVSTEKEAKVGEKKKKKITLQQKRRPLDTRQTFI